MMLNHDFYYPEIPPIPDFPGVSSRQDRWQRQAIFLWLAAQGFTLRTEIQRLTASLFFTDPRGGALMRVASDLRKDGLLNSKTLALPSGRGIKFSFVYLSEAGIELAQSLGWTVHESEWERMQRLHEKGNYQPQHTAAVLAFVYQARLRGWAAGVMPEVDAGWFQPDAVVEKGNESYYVEVELGSQKPAKWHNMASYQGVIALCARTPEHRRLLMEEVQTASDIHQCAILTTDLRTLFEQADRDSTLWAVR